MEKKRMGRPPKAPEDRAGPAIQFRVRGAVKEEIERQALLTGRSISEECEFRLTRSVLKQSALAEMLGGEEYGPLLLALSNAVRLARAITGGREDAQIQVLATIIRVVELLADRGATEIIAEASRTDNDWAEIAARVALLEKGALKSLSEVMGR